MVQGKALYDELHRQKNSQNNDFHDKTGFYVLRFLFCRNWGMCIFHATSKCMKWRSELIGLQQVAK